MVVIHAVDASSAHRLHRDIIIAVSQEWPFSKATPAWFASASLRKMKIIASNGFRFRAYPHGAERVSVPDHPEVLLVATKAQELRLKDVEYALC